MKYYLTYILDVENLVDEFKKETNFWLDKENAAINDFKKERRYFLTVGQRYYWEKLSEIAKICDFFGIECLDVNKTNIEIWLDTLYNPFGYSGDLEANLELALTNIKLVFQDAKTELSEKISLLEEDEKKRLTEALNCYVQELNYSAIVMSVSAIENRLFSLMFSKSHDKKLEELTLGQLIWECTHNKEKYGNIIPEKHEPLLAYCNNYRVFSVHPKKEKINRSNATAILCMSCSFLFDKNLKTKTE